MYFQRLNKTKSNSTGLNYSVSFYVALSMSEKSNNEKKNVFTYFQNTSIQFSWYTFWKEMTIHCCFNIFIKICQVACLCKKR